MCPPNDDAGVSGQTHRSAPTDGTASTAFEQTRPPNDDAGVSGQTHRSAPTDETASTGFGRANPALRVEQLVVIPLFGIIADILDYFVIGMLTANNMFVIVTLPETDWKIYVLRSLVFKVRHNLPQRSMP